MAEGTSLPPVLLIHRAGKVERSVSLNRDDMTIGRAEDCSIVLTDPRRQVSSHHARIFRQGGGYFLEDTGSRNNTILENERIRGKGPVALRDGIGFWICEYFLLFQRTKIQIQDGEDSSSAICASVDMATSSDQDFRPANLEETLRAVLEVSRTIGSTLNLQEILDKTLEALFVIFPQADRGFVYLKGTSQEELSVSPAAYRSRRGLSGPITVSRTVLRQVLENGIALCCEDIPTHGVLGDSPSLAGEGIRTMLSVPIVDRNRKPTGFLQLDARNPRQRFDSKDLDLLVAVVGQIGVAVENARLHQRLIQTIETEKEMLYAREVQRALLPERPPEVPGYGFWHHYEPAHKVGGDYFGYFPLMRSEDEPGHAPRFWGVAVADVVGKGMGAALLMAKLSAEVQIALGADHDPARAVARFNRRICEIAMSDRFITFLLVVLDTRQNQLTYVSAGHPAPTIRRPGGQIEVIGEDRIGLPLGIQDDVVYQATEITLGVGDLVTLYTDGVTEAFGPEETIFGSSRLYETLEQGPAEAEPAVKSVLQAVSQHAQLQPQSDDITLICFGPLPGPSE